MSVTPFHDHQDVPQLADHVMGFVDTQAKCDEVIAALKRIGVAEDRMLVLHGPDGRQFLERMMEGSLWGEEAEAAMKESEIELREGHFVLCVEAKERDEGLRIALEAKAHGGHGFNHFGRMIDERLTR
jgi:hypothetical protein